MRLTATLLALTFALLPRTAAADDCVILIHGLGRGDSSFLLMEQVLASERLPGRQP